ncbi:hypothetical protein [Streptomyces sp. NBRC 109706]|uniref:hypothetical protein n=1 Tax=Streptomyces sp. NBRC 109706 TaxID=1550035 RepID=UPI000B1AA375|nr:hypothetical protein [Streptomyces sp. NBRC 109706]
MPNNRHIVEVDLDTPAGTQTRRAEVIGSDSVDQAMDAVELAAEADDGVTVRASRGRHA